MALTARGSFASTPRFNEFSKSVNDSRYYSKSAQPPSSHQVYSTNVHPRYVPPFSIQSKQKNTRVIHGPLMNPPTTASARGKMTKPNKSKEVVSHQSLVYKTLDLAGRGSQIPRSSSFRMYFDRGDLPIKMEYLYGGDRIGWTDLYDLKNLEHLNLFSRLSYSNSALLQCQVQQVDIEKLDYSLYLPLFFDGLSETKHPYKTYARQGVSDLLFSGGDKIHPVIPQLVLPIKNALSTKDLEVMCTTLKIIQQLVMSSDLVGPALVPFYRQLLPMFNAFKVKNLNCGDEIDYSQKKNMNLGDLIDETLQVLELHGGEDAFINIKYMVPTYESCYLN